MKCSGCGKEVEKIASGYGNNFDGPKQFCDYCTDNHPDGVMKRMERAMQLRWPTTPQVDVTKIVGRNESCPCGSGKKFKKCCQRPLGKASGMSREQFSEELTRNLPGLRYLGCDPDATLPDGRKCSAFGFGPGAIDDPEIQVCLLTGSQIDVDEPDIDATASALEKLIGTEVSRVEEAEVEFNGTVLGAARIFFVNGRKLVLAGPTVMLSKDA